MRELSIEDALTSKVKAHGGFCFKMTGYKGIPDRLVLMPGGRAFFVELKKPGGIVSPAQTKRHEELSSKGFDVYVIANIEWLDSLLQGDE